MKQLLALSVDLVYPWLLENFIWFFVGLSAVLVHKANLDHLYPLPLIDLNCVLLIKL